ncbi:hypothetical protein Afil01_61190 [Actinorhabdospora filicis]|uniref:HTH merR-type domain-containing protein n=1 Tax=Actinorhabdospora filicis TaxID=1785913 RepID=A0A9W6SS80_9ACTN|nr:hypothetical protein Afil01_61190 [Actinorhabdospora filicis]
MTIGRFARLCRLSVKQLRHYDELGLLTPARVDAFTGYRYYTRAQARDALTIALLREADVPLPGIRAVLAAPDPTVALTTERDRLAARIERDRERLAVLTRLASGATHEITLVDEPALILAFESGTTTVDGLGATVGHLIGTLLGRTHAWRPPMWGLFPLDIADGMTVTVGAERVEGAAAGPGVTEPESGSGWRGWPVEPESGSGYAADPDPTFGPGSPHGLADGSQAGGALGCEVRATGVEPDSDSGSVSGFGPPGRGSHLAEPDSASGPSGPVRPTPAPLVLPATRAAVTLHHGPYNQLSLAYYAVLSWIHERGLRPVGPARESYLVTPGEAAPEELITRVVIPVEDPNSRPEPTPAPDPNRTEE